MQAGEPVGIVVPTWNNAAGLARCVAALDRLAYPSRFTVVVDNGSEPVAREAVATMAAHHRGLSLESLDVNRGFAGGVNVGLAAVFERGAAAALVVNDDAIVHPSVLHRLVRAAVNDPAAGIVAPRILDFATGREISRGERVSMPLVCLPRTWLRVRRRRAQPYAVGGVLGVAFLVTRRCWETLGPIAEAFFAYYEEVDYCLRARAAGFRILVTPRGRVRHQGHRGFGSGFTPLAAYLKVRNLPLLVRRHGGPLTWATFVPTYTALVLTSAALYAVRRRPRGILGAFALGVRDALRARVGPPPAALAERWVA